MGTPRRGVPTENWAQPAQNSPSTPSRRGVFRRRFHQIRRNEARFRLETGGPGGGSGARPSGPPGGPRFYKKRQNICQSAAKCRNATSFAQNLQKLTSLSLQPCHKQASVPNRTARASARRRGPARSHAETRDNYCSTAPEQSNPLPSHIADRGAPKKRRAPNRPSKRMCIRTVCGCAWNRRPAPQRADKPSICRQDACP